ncbi:MAG TPA: HlyD family efflux transporter periplasmic adaptor subunit [Ramlibacter sp.]|nr:HlyD family efflux transporter periplasmic adaptor subunit [Ramlibacter sp.]
MKRARLAALGALMLVAACSKQDKDSWSGYADGDYVYVAAPIAGQLSSLNVAAGQQVAKGKPLFALDDEAEKAAREEANARLSAASFQAADTEKGKREAEVSVNQAQLAQARAQAELARNDLTRKRELLAKNFIAKAQVDEALHAWEQAQARVAELSSAVQVARLPARSDERAAAQAQVDAARQVLRQNEWREQQKQQLAPADAQVADTFFRPGEFVNAGQPVVSLLPPANVKARFYVPETRLQSIALGGNVTLHCDGCQPINARVTFISTKPEYTPPVIYSNEERAKLVFLVEAKPSPADAPKLRPGQPLQVTAAK